MIPSITTFRWVPPFARGHVRDIRARWAFEETGVAYHVDLVESAKTPEHRAFQPFGQVPTYRDDRVELFESGAIVLHIARQAPGLLPADPPGRARAEQWVIAALNSVEPFVTDLVTVDLFQADKPWSSTRRPAVVEALRARLGDLATALGDKTFLDDAFSAGDLIMACVLRSVPRNEILAAYPTLLAYLDRCTARPAFRKALADRLALYAPADKRAEVTA
ncbi:glutathione S-transferase family protein [Sphingomonas sp. TREG-RG-20F-R18-01]|uniref:glutathione S-transferase family protein n=1 Tax=Sphingomonas sp. TREG-RG-20F-R18-01 TaxID=2914982 RepID=UPI001F563B4C|nr:glutathione S-transferase family protein [Sphingomonas sp. TREG-RG-20F-R18-01]